MNYCEACGTTSQLQRHHRFSQSALNRSLYGDLIDDPRNIQILCYHHHINCPVEKWGEVEFCENLGIKPRGKLAKLVWDRKHPPNCDCDICLRNW